MPFTVAIIAEAIPPARRLYSIAVAPDSSLKNDLRVCMMPVDSTATVTAWLPRGHKKGPADVQLSRGKGAGIARGY